MEFSVVIFFGALWALSSEMIEDSFVNLILGHLYGWKTLIEALIVAAAVLLTLSAVLVYRLANYWLPIALGWATAGGLALARRRDVAPSGALEVD